MGLISCWCFFSFPLFLPLLIRVVCTCTQRLCTLGRAAVRIGAHLKANPMKMPEMPKLPGMPDIPIPVSFFANTTCIYCLSKYKKHRKHSCAEFQWISCWDLVFIASSSRSSWTSTGTTRAALSRPWRSSRLAKSLASGNIHDVGKWCLYQMLMAHVYVEHKFTFVFRAAPRPQKTKSTTRTSGSSRPFTLTKVSLIHYCYMRCKDAPLISDDFNMRCRRLSVSCSESQRSKTASWWQIG